MENVPLFLSRLEVQLNFEEPYELCADTCKIHTFTHVDSKPKSRSYESSFCAFFIFYCISILKHLLLTQFGKEKIENGSCYLE